MAANLEIGVVFPASSAASGVASPRARSTMAARFILRCLLAAAVAQVGGAAHAGCNNYLDFGQLNAACGGGVEYCFVTSPGINTADSIFSSFWSLKTGDPVAGQGDDNGTWDSRNNWLLPFEPGSVLLGDWSASSGIDGCIEGRIPPEKSSEVMAVAFSDTDAMGAYGYFAIATVARNPLGYPQFDFSSGLGTDIGLVLIPRPVVASAERISPSTWLLDIAPPPATALAPGFYSDGSTVLSEAVVGYRIYRRDIDFGESPPSDRHRSAWTPATGIVPLGEHASLTVDCLGKPTFLATALVFDSGFETGHVSEQLWLVLCGRCSIDFDGDGFSYDVECPPSDCDDSDPYTHPFAPEVNDGKDNQCPWDSEWIPMDGYGIIDEISGPTGFFNAADPTGFFWQAQVFATRYEVARSDLPDFSVSCVVASVQAPPWQNQEVPEPGAAFYYLVRPVTPHVGSWGQNSAGAERSNVCP